VPARDVSADRRIRAERARGRGPGPAVVPGPGTYSATEWFGRSRAWRTRGEVRLAPLALHRFGGRHRYPDDDGDGGASVPDLSVPDVSPVCPPARGSPHPCSATKGRGARAGCRAESGDLFGDGVGWSAPALGPGRGAARGLRFAYSETTKTAQSPGRTWPAALCSARIFSFAALAASATGKRSFHSA
jgi:hypothetical protein